MSDKNKFYRFIASVAALLLAFATALLARLNTAFQTGVLEPIDWLIMVLFIILSVWLAYWGWELYPRQLATKKKKPPD